MANSCSAGAGIIVALGLALAASPALADMTNVNSLQSKRAVCCNEYDGRPPEAIWELSDGSVPNVHYRVMIEHQWVNVPDEAVLDVPNKYGVAVVWYSANHYGGDADKSSFFIRCFLPGQLF